jgi:bacterial/archaeal transporter family protein
VQQSRATTSAGTIPAHDEDRGVSSTLLSALLGVCGMFGWGVYDYLGAALSKRMGSFAPLFWSQTAGAATIVLAALAVRSSWGVPIKSLLLVPVAAGLYCGGYLFFFTGFEKGNVSIVAATCGPWSPWSSRSCSWVSA